MTFKYDNLKFGIWNFGIHNINLVIDIHSTIPYAHNLSIQRFDKVIFFLKLNWLNLQVV